MPVECREWWWSSDWFCYFDLKQYFEHDNNHKYSDYDYLNIYNNHYHNFNYNHNYYNNNYYNLSDNKYFELQLRNRSFSSMF